jgi:hypothetical protein
MELRRQLKAESAASKRGSPSPTIRRASIMVRRKSSSVASAREIEVSVCCHNQRAWTYILSFCVCATNV